MSDIHNGPHPIENGAPPGDETVARLLQLAGNRPSIPAADAAIVKAAARAEWQNVVWASRRRRLYVTRGIGGFLAAAAVALLALNSQFLDRVRRAVTPPVAHLAAVSGGPVGLEQQFWANDVVATNPASSATTPRVALAMRTGASLRVDADTRLRLQSASVLELERGTLYVDSNGSSVEVRTPFGVVTNIGTRFEVHLAPDDSSLRVRVREGRVQLQDVEGEIHVAAAGQQLTSDGAGTQVGGVEACGSTWDWLLTVRTPFTGNTTFELLEWAAAEGGWALRFKGNAEASARAAAAMSEKEYQNLPRLEDDLQVWVPAAGLRHRFEGCVLIVEPRG